MNPPLYIDHRRNTTEQLLATDRQFGVEIDIRSRGDRLVLAHDPFVDGEDFESWLEAYEHAFLIANVKEEGLEERVEALLGKKSIQDYFFLDQSFPFMVKTARRGNPRCAVRFSEFESAETLRALSGLVDWVWIDCFTHFPVDAASLPLLRKFKTCLVSPELQGRWADEEIFQIVEQCRALDFNPDAVCSKKIDVWRACFVS